MKPYSRTTRSSDSGSSFSTVLKAPDTAPELASAAANADPITLSRGTRAAFLKRAILRLLRVYTFGQVLFNRALLNVVTSLDQTLRGLLEVIEERLYSVEVRLGDAEEEIADLAVHAAAQRESAARTQALEKAFATGRAIEGRLERSEASFSVLEERTRT